MVLRPTLHRRAAQAKAQKPAARSARLSGRLFRDTEVGVHLHAVAYHQATFLVSIEMPDEIADFSLTSLQLKLINMGPALWAMPAPSRSRVLRWLCPVP